MSPNVSQYHQYMKKPYKEYLGLYQYPAGRLWEVSSHVGDARELASPASLWVLALKLYGYVSGLTRQKFWEPDLEF